MASPLQAIMAMLQGQRPQVTQVRPDFGLTGAQIGPQRSPYERTMASGETRSAQDLQSMLGEVILAAGSGALPAIGPRGQARQPPGGRLAKGIKGQNGTEIVGYDWRSKIDDVVSQRDGGLVSKRVSDWERKDTSTGTGRDIVHVFDVKHPDGTITKEGINSAQHILGLSPARLNSIASGERTRLVKREQAAVQGQRDVKAKAESDSWFSFLEQHGQGQTTLEKIQSLGGFKAARERFELTK